MTSADGGGTAVRAPQVAAQTIEVRGAPVALRRHGSGRPLLFLHGMGFTSIWLRFHEALAAGADVIAPEHIGFGDTPMTDWLEDIDDLAMHYDDLADVLGLDTFDLVGYSLGGWIAAKYAAWFPRRVRSLTLLVPAGVRLEGSPMNPDIFLHDPEQLTGALFHDPANMDEVMALPEGVDPLDAQMRMYDQMATGALLVWNPRHDRKLPRQLGRYGGPALLVGAEHDRLLLRENTVDAYAQLLPQARRVEIPGTGHALVVEQPQAVADAILDFTGGVA